MKRHNNTFIDRIVNPFNGKFKTSFAWGAAIAGGVALAGTAVSAVSAMNGANAKKKAQKGAERIAQQAVSGYDSANIPEIEQQLLQLERIKSSGNLTPEQEQVIEQKQSELQAIQANPDLRTAQMQALRKLQEVGTEGGLTAVDKAQLNDITNATNRQEQANRNALVQNFQQRGMGGSGVELAAQLAGNQASGEEASKRGFDVSAQAQQRALDAIQKSGALGSQIEGQQFGQDAQKANAQDAINRFNTQNQQSILGQNVQRSNYAQERNLNNEQQLNASNVGISNQEQVANKGLYQKQFENEMNKASGKANALTNQANVASKGGDADAALYGALGQAAAKVGSSVGSYLDDNKKKKEE